MCAHTWMHWIEVAAAISLLGYLKAVSGLKKAQIQFTYDSKLLQNNNSSYLIVVVTSMHRKLNTMKFNWQNFLVWNFPIYGREVPTAPQ